MSGWGEWESTEWEQPTAAEADSPRLQLAPPLPDHREDAAPNTPAQQRPRPPAGRKVHRAHRRAIAAQRQAKSRTEQRRALDALTRASGLPAAIAAVVVFAVLIVVNVTGNDQKDTARPGPGTAIGSGDASATRTGDTPPTTGAGAMTLDPHAGTEVLPPQALPPAPGVSDVDATMPLQVAGAFAREACATSSEESATAYSGRLSPYATDQIAASWSRGAAMKVRCLQFTAAADPARAATGTTMPVVVTAVQVYDAGGEADLVAYRWRITPTLTKQEDGTWVVSG